MMTRFPHFVLQASLVTLFLPMPGLSASLAHAAGSSDAETEHVYSASASASVRIQRAFLTPGETSAESSRFGIRIQAQAFASMGARSDRFAIQSAPLDVPDASNAAPVEQASAPPASFKAMRAVPSVFRQSTAIRYQLPTSSEVVLDLYSPSGRLVTRIDEGTKPPGEHVVRWDGIDAAGQRAASGVYFYVLRAGSNTALGRLILMK